MSRDARRHAHLQGHARADGAAQAPLQRRRASGRLEGRLRRTGCAEEPEAHRAAGRLHPRPRDAGVRARRFRSADWQKPVAEAEIAAYMGQDLPARCQPRRRAQGDRRHRSGDRACRHRLPDGRRRGDSLRRHLPAPCHPRPARHHAPGRAACRAQGPRHAQRQRCAGAGRSRNQHRRHCSTSCAMWRTSPKRSATSCAPGSSSSAAR